MTVQKLTLGELQNKSNEWKKAVIVFDNKSWKKDFSLEARSYKVSSDCKYFGDYLGSSLYGNALDGSDNDVRLDRYIGDWIIEYCYIVE